MTRTLLALALALAPAALALACTATNEAHCNFRGGDEFCASAHGERRFCSVCVAEFDGCADAAPDAGCLPEGSASAVTTDDPSAASTAPSSDATGEATSGTSSAEASSSSSATTGEGSSSTTASSETATSSTSSDSDTAGPSCGDDMAEGQESCDGDDLKGMTCAQITPWSGGALACADDCMSFDVTGCCLGEGSDCLLTPNKCCGMLTCVVNTCG